MKSKIRLLLFLIARNTNRLFVKLNRKRFNKKIAIVSCDKWLGKVKEDELLKFELNKLFVDVDIVSWQDGTVDYSKYDGVIIRSLWGYQDYIQEFMMFLDKLKKEKINVFNDVDILKDNLNKYEQFKILDKYQIPHIETFFFNKDELSNVAKICKEYKDLVVKPIISGSGNNTFIISDTINKNNISVDEVKNRFDKVLNETNNYLMVQPFVKEIDNGEISVVLIDNKISHIVVRNTSVFNDKSSIMVLGLDAMDEKMKSIVDSCSNIKEYNKALYMRIDLVKIDKDYKVMELELVEPQLFLGFRKTKKQLVMFAKAIRKKI
jgi:glutathione synthase/RimK-type ligase-like ATP-grasp enzyme